MHSYREAFEDDEAGGFANSPTFGGGGENSPQTPRFPVSPQTPYFNLCRSTLSAHRGCSQIFINLLIFSCEMTDTNIHIYILLRCYDGINIFKYKSSKPPK